MEKEKGERKRKNAYYQFKEKLFKEASCSPRNIVLG